VETKTELDKFSGYANEILVETLKHEIHSRWRRDRLKQKPAESRDAMFKRWYRAEAQSRKRLVLKIVKLVEGFTL
jgi:hypothetical protein